MTHSWAEPVEVGACVAGGLETAGLACAPLAVDALSDAWQIGNWFADAYDWAATEYYYWSNSDPCCGPVSYGSYRGLRPDNESDPAPWTDSTGGGDNSGADSPSYPSSSSSPHGNRSRGHGSAGHRPVIDRDTILRQIANTPHPRPPLEATIAPEIQQLIDDVQAGVEIMLDIPSNHETYRPAQTDQSTLAANPSAGAVPQLGSDFGLDDPATNPTRVNVFHDGVLYKWDSDTKSWHPIAWDTSDGPAETGSAVQQLDPWDIRLSQTSVTHAAEIVTSMQESGWVGDPIDVVRMPDGELTTIDNTRVIAAGHAGIGVQAVVHPFDEPLPGPAQIDRFTTRKGVPTTWGEAIMLRIGKQSAAYRNRWPYGSPWTSWDGN